MSQFDLRKLLPLVAVLAACATKETGKNASTADSAATPVAVAVAPHQMTVIATDFKFDAPDAVPSGMMTIHLVDNGTELHHVAFVKLNDGKTMSDVEQLLKSKGAPPAWFVDAGGVNPPHPGGGMASATEMLEPGNYVLLCFVESVGGVPHFTKGMMRPLTVTASAGPSAPAPEADIVVTLSDYSFTLSKPLTAGKHTIRIESNGTQSHELFLGRLAPGKKAADIPVWALNPVGPPPAEPLGGVPAMAHGMSAYITVEFAPGEYALICFLPDVKDGKPHFTHGMVQQEHVS